MKFFSTRLLLDCSDRYGSAVFDGGYLQSPERRLLPLAVLDAFRWTRAMIGDAFLFPRQTFAFVDTTHVEITNIPINRAILGHADSRLRGLYDEEI